jgi:hypothetical protein
LSKSLDPTAGHHRWGGQPHKVLAKGELHPMDPFRGQNRIKIFRGFCVYWVPLPPLQHTVLCHPRWLPTSGLTEFVACWGEAGFEPKNNNYHWATSPPVYYTVYTNIMVIYKISLVPTSWQNSLLKFLFFLILLIYDNYKIFTFIEIFQKLKFYTHVNKMCLFLWNTCEILCLYI